VGLHIPFPILDWQSTVGHPLPHGFHLVFEGLFAWGKDFNPEPELAEWWKASDDNKIWTFGLRKRVLFHNGKEMTAEDVKASIERWKKVGLKGPMLKDLEEIKVVDKYTVQFKFNVINCRNPHEEDSFFNTAIVFFKCSRIKLSAASGSCLARASIIASSWKEYGRI